LLEVIIVTSEFKEENLMCILDDAAARREALRLGLAPWLF